jgi:4-amino-4-deoxy-L-arabinose transferase-like glycosyltransferase
MIQYFRSHKIVLVLLLAVVVRLAVMVVLRGMLAFEATGAVHGSEAYDIYAQNLLATGVYGREAGTPDANIPPLYSYALAGVYGLIGRGYAQVGLFHILLDCASIWMLYEIGRRLMPGGESVALLAGVFYALYPYLVFQNLTLIDTPFFMLLLYAFILLMVLLRDRRTLDKWTWTLAALGGVVLGLSMLTRALLPLFALLTAVWFLFRLSLRQTILRLLPVALVGVVVVLPWIVRNYQVYGVFVPTSLNLGDNFYQGNSIYTIPFFRAGYDVQWSPIPPLKAADKNSPEASAERTELGMQYLRQHPEQIPELLWVKFLVHWSIDIAPRHNPGQGERLGLDDDGNFIIQRVDAAGQALTYGADDPVNAYTETTFARLSRYIHIVYWGGLFFLGSAGLVLTVSRWRDVSLLWFAHISMTVMYIIFHPSTRYRVPTDPLWFLFSAYAVIYAWTWWRDAET